MEAQANQQNFSNLDWNNKQFLGKGSYGSVYKIKDKQNSKQYALKEIIIDKYTPQQLENLKKQISIQKQLQNSHIVSLIGYKVTKQKAYIIMELCTSDLQTLIAKNNKNFPQEQSIKVLKQAFQGFKFLVQKGYIHRDIKPANILISQNTYKIADFGFAIKADMNYLEKINNFCGTPIYMAPQILFKQPYTAKCDIWSIGLMLYEMIYGYPPWPTRNLNSYINGIKNKKVSFPFNKKIGANTKNFIQKTLVIQQQSRMSWEEMFNHPLVKNEEPGQQIPLINVNNFARKALQYAQTQVKNQKINSDQIFQKYQKLKVLNFTQFQQLMKQISPSITSHGILSIFQFGDKDKSKTIDYKQFRNLFEKVDFRDASDFKSRILEEIANMIKFKKMSVDVLFNEIDQNKSGSLDWQEFDRFLSLISKDLKLADKMRFFNILDSDGSSFIQRGQFKLGLKDLVNENVEQKSNEKRGKRNIVQFGQYLKNKDISALKFMRKWDQDKDGNISVLQFKKAVKEIEFEISDEQIGQLFTIIDSNNSESLCIVELIKVINVKSGSK